MRDESERLSEKNKRRNKIRAVAEKVKKEGNLKKAKRIWEQNLGRKKYQRKKRKARKKIQTYIGRAVQEFFEQRQPEVVVGESLNFSYLSKKTLPRKVRRYFSSWIKGVLQGVIEMRCLRSGATYVPVNAVYTPQVCSWCSCFGKRAGDTFHYLKEGCGKAAS